MTERKCSDCEAPVSESFWRCWPCHHRLYPNCKSPWCPEHGTEKTSSRPSWDDYFFDMARAVARRATCPRASIGVVLVSKGHYVIATGFNGAPSGDPHCTDVGCELFANHCVRAKHAERNAVDGALKVFAAVAGWNLTEYDEPDDAYRGLLKNLEPTAYVVGPRDVCSECARVLFLAGVKEVKVKEA